MSPKLELAAEPVQRGKLLWTWEAIISRGFVLGRFPTRMCIAGYPLAEGQIGLVVISPLDPAEAVVQWLQRTGQVRRSAAAAVLLQLAHAHCNLHSHSVRISTSTASRHEAFISSSEALLR
jgi:hypothetical protein